MLIESIKHNPESSKLVNTPYSPAIKPPSKGYFKLDLHQAWVNFIKTFEPFQWYVTLTFKESRHPESADKAFFRWIRHINESLYGRRYRERKKGVTWIKAIEYQRREVIHFHCLVGSPELYKLRRLDFMKLWESDCMNTQEIINGYARINGFDPSRGAVSYLSKYVLKDGEIDVYVSPEQLRAFNNTEPTLDLKFIN